MGNHSDLGVGCVFVLPTRRCEMNHRDLAFTSLAFACALSLASAVPMQAQEQTTTKQTTTTTTTETYESPNWQGPRGYAVAYPENGTPNMVARQGYAAGFNQGQADASQGKKFKPTESGAYEHAKIPKGMNKD